MLHLPPLGKARGPQQPQPQPTLPWLAPVSASFLVSWLIHTSYNYGRSPPRSLFSPALSGLCQLSGSFVQACGASRMMQKV